MRAWQLIAEDRIQQAIVEGEFDNLPGFGQPLDCLDQPFSHEQWLRAKAKREQLNLLPPAIQLRVDVAKRTEAILQLKDEALVRSAISELNALIEKRNREILWGPPSTTMPIDVEPFVERWKLGR